MNSKRILAVLLAGSVIGSVVRAQTYKPHKLRTVDLVALSVDASGVTGDWQTLLVAGSVQVQVRNDGRGPSPACRALAFEDRNGNSAFEPAVDSSLGTAFVPQLAAGQTSSVSIQVAGTVSFRDNRIHVWLDHLQAIPESDESNNITHSGAGCQFMPSAPSWDLHTEWMWQETQGHGVDGARPGYGVAVGDLDGHDGDGVPEIVLTTFLIETGDYPSPGYLTILDGRTGAERLTVATPRVDYTSTPAIADVDGDGNPNIVVLNENDTHLLCFEPDGSPTSNWNTTAVPGRSTSIPASRYYGACPAIADLEADGQVEVIIGRIVFRGTNGEMLWQGAGGQGAQWAFGQQYGRLSFPADLDADGVMEVVCGRTAYRADGTVLWSLPLTEQDDGYDAVADLDGDGIPEIVQVARGVARVITAAGAIVASRTIDPGQRGGPPAIADFNGDGQPDIAVAGYSSLWLLDRNLNLLWPQPAPINDCSSGWTGPAGFDFDGDGAAEIVYRDALLLRVIDGSTGMELFTLPVTSGTAWETPVIADIDADGTAEIVTVGDVSIGCWSQVHSGVWALSEPNRQWTACRRLWNQHSYHVTNIEDDLSVPRQEPIWWAGSNGFRSQSPSGSPDLSASFLRTVAGPTSYDLTVRVGNGGAAPVPAGVSVMFYDGDPMSGGLALGSSATGQQLFPGQYSDVTLSLPAGFTLIEVLHAIADDFGSQTGEINECDETNNLL